MQQEHPNGCGAAGGGVWTRRPSQAILLPGAALCLCSFIVGACASDMDGAENETIANAREPLATGIGTKDTRFTTPWASPGTVNVCYITRKNTSTTPPTDTAIDPTMRADTEFAISKWSEATGLTFTIQGRCPVGFASGWISIFLDPNANNGVSAMGGLGNYFGTAARNAVAAGEMNIVMANGQTLGTLIDNRTDVAIYVGSRAGEFRRQIAHEFGHTLGFYHEMERSDHSGETNCAAGTNAAGHITVVDRNSVMLWSYCLSPSEPEVREDVPLSPLDQLGAEMLYPKRYSGHPIACSDGCIRTSNGTVVRSNGAITTDWIQRGADTGAIGVPTWHYGSSTATNSDGRLRASSLSSGTQTVTMDFKDAYQRSHAGTGTVVKSDALHTAITQTAVNGLVAL
jgi:hypothetical protein